MTQNVESMSLDEINARLAEVADDMRDRWEELSAIGEQSLIADWVDEKMPGIRELTDARRDQVHGLLAADSMEEIGRQLGWSNAELQHAIDSRMDADSYEGECVVLTHSGREIRTPAYPDQCDYVRIVHQGFEVAYWTADEWKSSPEEVMGAIVGCLKADVPTPDRDVLGGRVPGQRSGDHDRG